MEKASRKKVGFFSKIGFKMVLIIACLLYTSPSPRD